MTSTLQAAYIRPPTAKTAAAPSHGEQTRPAAGQDSFAGILDSVEDGPTATAAAAPTSPQSQPATATPAIDMIPMAAQTDVNDSMEPAKLVKATPKSLRGKPALTDDVDGMPGAATSDTDPGASNPQITPVPGLPGVDGAAANIPQPATLPVPPSAGSQAGVAALPVAAPSGTAAEAPNPGIATAAAAVVSSSRKAPLSGPATVKADAAPAISGLPEQVESAAQVAPTAAHPQGGRRLAASARADGFPIPTPTQLPGVMAADPLQLLQAEMADAITLPQGSPHPASGATIAPAAIPQAADQPPPLSASGMSANVVATSPTVDPKTPGVTTSPPPTVRQVAAALVHLAQTGGNNTVTLRLDPAELGHVQIRINRNFDGTNVVHVAAERPETLQMLIGDQAALHRTLDNAGLSQDGRSLNFSLATPDSGGNASTDRGSGGSSGFMGNGSFAGNGGQQGGGWRQDRSPYPEAQSNPTQSTNWQRAGVDITA